MAYKDKDKQREADKARQQRRRDELQGVTPKGVTDEGVMTEVIVTPFVEAPILPTNYGQSDCECMHCQSKRINNSKNIINHGPYKTQYELDEHEINRVSLPGDPDYNGVCLDAKHDNRRIQLKSSQDRSGDV